MILNIIRLLLLVLLILTLIFDFNIPIFLKNPNNQLGIALIVLFILLIIDVSIGFLLGLIFLILYYKMYDKLLTINNKEKGKEKFKNINNDSNNSNICKIIIPYISAELLKSAQNNIFSDENYKSEIKGFTSEKKIYGAQGLDIDKNNYAGYDKNINYSSL